MNITVKRIIYSHCSCVEIYCWIAGIGMGSTISCCHFTDI